MITIFKDQQKLILQYRVEVFFGGVEHVDTRLQRDGEVTIGRVFTFKDSHRGINNNIVEDDEDTRTFVLGELKNDFFEVEKDILGIKFDLRLHKDLRINIRTFVAASHISVFGQIDALIDEPIVVGGGLENAIPPSDFETLLANFPTTATQKHFMRSRVSRILKDYFGTMTDAEKALEKHLSRTKPILAADPISVLNEYEVSKYEYIRDRLNEMLAKPEGYSEADWQIHMLKFLLLIFPKYVAVLNNVHIKDFYANPARVSNRYIDLTLVDANGNIDIIEIKKPFDNCLLAAHQYRDNYVPKKELSGSVMQIEKYIFHLNKWGIEGERELNRKRAAELPAGLQIKVTNPKAMIILGRDKDFAADQLFDFEIIKRKYANIVDVMTYDDLLRRLENIIQKFKVLS